MFGNFIENRIRKKISAFEAIDGWLTPNEALGLYLLASKLPPHATVVEIGSWQGKSTYCLARGLRSGTIHAIDPFNASGGFDLRSEQEYMQKKADTDLLALFRENMSRLGVLHKINVKQGYSSQFAGDFEKIDLLFIDGDHSIPGCIADFEQYAPRLAPGGWIAFHDYYAESTDLGSTFVVNNLVMPSANFRFYRSFDTLWTARKIR
ncbi:class I SAM-dependent methyltransferase [Chitinophaga alhagiae]|uniref:class I SAM-dependent methyltransferase n=1 Tax=Chitinophaga alhagiae TaxID=2203219 RepID=UPI000E5C2501|nr:class I SAM-dependent methyltransferase [Chitinophaga alhagiae]